MALVRLRAPMRPIRAWPALGLGYSYFGLALLLVWFVLLFVLWRFVGRTNSWFLALVHCNIPIIWKIAAEINPKQYFYVLFFFWRWSEVPPYAGAFVTLIV